MAAGQIVACNPKADQNSEQDLEKDFTNGGALTYLLQHHDIISQDIIVQNTDKSELEKISSQIVEKFNKLEDLKFSFEGEIVVITPKTFEVIEGSFIKFVCTYGDVGETIIFNWNKNNAINVIVVDDLKNAIFSENFENINETIDFKTKLNLKADYPGKVEVKLNQNIDQTKDVIAVVSELQVQLDNILTSSQKFNLNTKLYDARVIFKQMFDSFWSANIFADRVYESDKKFFGGFFVPTYHDVIARHTGEKLTGQYMYKVTLPAPTGYSNYGIYDASTDSNKDLTIEEFEYYKLSQPTGNFSLTEIKNYVNTFNSSDKGYGFIVSGTNAAKLFDGGIVAQMKAADAAPNIEEAKKIGNLGDISDTERGSLSGAHNMAKSVAKYIYDGQKTVAINGENQEVNFAPRHFKQKYSDNTVFNYYVDEVQPLVDDVNTIDYWGYAKQGLKFRVANVDDPEVFSYITMSIDEFFKINEQKKDVKMDTLKEILDKNK
ncbi:hypothetical protein SCLARK_00191 [Spiroplasma clarkii]|nr:hypothetical protein SCLARK_00191 [Spiroplasma clarkii]